MAPKKNKKGNKLARMNDEEKLRYLQHRAAVEEETRRRKEQLVATYLKNKLKKEEAFTRLNTAKLNQQWRHNLRKFKCKELKDEMTTMENRFEVLLECKNNHIDMLLKDLEDAEEQNLKQYGAHVEVISQFLSLHKTALEELYARYDDKKKSLLDELKHTFGRTREIFTRDDQRLELVSAVFESRNDDDTRQTHVDFEDSIAVLNNEMLFEKDRFAKIRFAEMQTTVKKLRKVLDDYGEETDCKRNHYNYLKTRDEANAAAIEQNDKRIREYSEEIETLTRLRAEREVQYERRENELRGERDELARRYLASRDRLDSDRNAYRKKLEAMTRTCKTVADKLSSIVEKGERIIKTADNCAKLLCDDDNDDDDADVTVVSDEDDGGEPDDDMWKFWKRCARAEMQCRQLDAKRAKLTRENDDLKAALAYYLKTIARPASVQRDMRDGGIQLNLLPVKAG